MDRWYIPTPAQPNISARTSALSCALYGPVSPWLTRAIGATALPVVVLSNGQNPYTVIADDGSLTKATVDTAATPFLAIEATQTAAATALAADITALHSAAATARSTTVTSGNNVAVTQQILNALAVLCDRLANYLATQQ